MKAKLQAIRPEKAEPSADPTRLMPSVQFEFSNIAADTEQELNFLLKLSAPEVEMERKPLHLVATLDRSGSMMGDKLRFAKESAVKLVEHLGPEDYFTMFTFDHQVVKLNPSGFMTPENKQRLIRAIQEIQCRGSTNLSGAYLEGLRCLRETEGKVGAIKRLIFFTDGQASTGVTQYAQFMNLVEQNLTADVSVSTFGYGEGHDAELMASISSRQKGNFYYVKEPDECATAFATELGGLLSMFGQNLKLFFEEKENFDIGVFTDLQIDDSNRYQVNDVYAGESRMVTGSVTIPKHKKMPRGVSVIKGQIVYDNLVTGKQETVDFNGKVKFVKASAVDKDPNEEVRNQVIFDRAAQAHAKAQVLADQGDYVAAKGLIVSAADIAGDMAADLGLVGSTYDVANYSSNRVNVRGLRSSLSSRRGYTNNSWSNQTESVSNTVASFQADPPLQTGDSAEDNVQNSTTNNS